MKLNKFYRRLLFMLKNLQVFDISKNKVFRRSQRNKFPLQKFMESKALLNFQVESLIQLRKTKSRMTPLASMWWEVS